MQHMIQREYICNIGECISYEGMSFGHNKYEEYLQERVKNKFQDAEWSQMLTDSAVELTGFSEENFIEIFDNREEISSWKIGEILAECCLEDYYNARFYYNGSRDAKNLRSSLTGADLVGFCNVDDEVYFLFGEVKTSSDTNSPPQVLYGKTGMIEQLERLKENKNKRHDLVKWIFSKATLIKGEFLSECKEAMVSYINSGYNKIQLTGVLVRDTEPNEKDLKARAKALDDDMPTNMKAKLLSIYTGLKMTDNKWEKAMNRGV